MRHARRLLESRSFLDRVPDQGLLVSEAGMGAAHVRATRGADGSYAFVYLPSGESVTVDLGRLSGGAVEAAWFDPRVGTIESIGRFEMGRAETFRAPNGGPGQDWVLVLDDAARGFPAVGG